MQLKKVIMTMTVRKVSVETCFLESKCFEVILIKEKGLSCVKGTVYLKPLQESQLHISLLLFS